MFELIIFLPLFGFLIAGLFGKFISDRGVELLTTSFMILSALFAWISFFALDEHSLNVNLMDWLAIETLHINWSVYIDKLSSIMLVVVSTVSALVHLYSIGYMHTDKSRIRFFAYISFFTFMMYVLVTANNLVQLFFGWEGVGLVSYLLIGFWFTKDSANNAALKAFIVNRVGDFSFLLGIFSIYYLFDSVQFKDIFTNIAQINYSDTMPYIFGITTKQTIITIISFLLFIGAMGKSAQFLLHVWLPDAMEGPTPVSALIHAATMVTAGVYLVCRMSPLFNHALFISSFIIIVGSITAFFAATVAMVQNDIKRIIAYSTCSQLGYMFAALGAKAYDVGMFHLFTHAFFKALLFLGAGSVIHAVVDEQDIRKMGGLFKYLPITYSVMIIGTLSITGVGIPGTLFGSSGFFSKDAILEALYTSHNIMAPYAFWLLVFVALLTSFYSWRLIFMTFHGKAKASVEAMHHIHEANLYMVIPLLFLAAGALFAGIFFNNYFIAHEFEVNNLIKFMPFVAMILGFFIAFIFYIVKPTIPNILASKLNVTYNFLLNKWYIDELYQYIFVKPICNFGSFLYHIWDISIFEQIGPKGVGGVIFYITNKISNLQTGFVYHYAFVILTGVVFFLTWNLIGSIV